MKSNLQISNLQICLIVFIFLVVQSLVTPVKTITVSLEQSYINAFPVNIWENRTSEIRPPARIFPAMVYAPDVDRVILFGGQSMILSGTPLNDTWSYDYETNSWTNMQPLNSPPLCTFAFATYDIQFQKVILLCNINFTRETWAYDYKTNSWTNLTTGKQPLELCPMTYDVESNVTIAYCYWGSTYKLWAYSYKNNTWWNIMTWNITTTDMMPKGDTVGLAYDSKHDKIIALLYSVSVHGYMETWSYDYNTNKWTNVTDPVYYNSSLSSFGDSITYDTRSDRIITFSGGWDEHVNWTMVYNYNMRTWKNMNPAISPSKRVGYGLVYDSQSDRIILFGGGVAEFSGETHWSSDETWVYNLPAAPFPPENLRIESAEKKVVLKWDSPLDDGGYPVKNYTIYRNNMLLVTIENQTSYTDENVKVGENYTYKIKAINDWDASEFSNEIKVTVIDEKPVIPIYGLSELSVVIVLIIVWLIYKKLGTIHK